MRIAIWYEGISLGRNDGNPIFVYSFLRRVQHFCDALEGRQLNPKLLAAFPNDPPFDPRAEELAKELHAQGERTDIEHIRPNGEYVDVFGKFDVHLWIDWGEDGLKGVLPYDPVIPTDAPLIYWTSDTHLGFDYRLNLAKKSNAVFCAQKRAVDEFKDSGVHAIWLPHAFEPLAYPRRVFASRTYDVSFVGHVNSKNRKEALDRLFREFPNFFWGQRRFEAAAEIYNKSRVCFNIAMKDDLNMRVFEVLGCGGFLLTDDIPTIHDIFEHGKHLVLYKDLDEMVKLAKYYIRHEKERRKIAETGHRTALSNHTISHRVRRLLEAARKLLSKETVHG